LAPQVQAPEQHSVLAAQVPVDFAVSTQEPVAQLSQGPEQALLQQMSATQWVE
jgi:hypothetical protein